MNRSFAYDRSHEPPAPVIPVHVAAPGLERATLIRALIDSGADCTVVPERVVRDLALPRIDRVEIVGVTGSPRLAPVHVAQLRFMRIDLLWRVVALDGEAILGRDLLHRLRLELDGPRQQIRLLGGRTSRVRR